jgi:hypothetical protein
VIYFYLTSSNEQNMKGAQRRFEPTACGRVTNAAKAPGVPPRLQRCGGILFEGDVSWGKSGQGMTSLASTRCWPIRWSIL